MSISKRFSNLDEPLLDGEQKVNEDVNASLVLFADQDHLINKAITINPDGSTTDNRPRWKRIIDYIDAELGLIVYPLFYYCLGVWLFIPDDIGITNGDVTADAHPLEIMFWRYVNGFYFVSTSITSVGYGDISPPVDMRL